MKFDKRRELVLIHQKEIERANTEKQKRLEEKEKERQLIKENQRKEKLMEQEKQKLEYEKRLTQSKEKVESIMENIRQGIEYKHLMNIKRFNEIMEQRESKLKQRQEQNKKKSEEIQNKLEQNRILKEKRNEQILLKQKMFEENAIKNEKIKIQKIMEKSRSQHTLYLENKKRRITSLKHLEKKYQKINQAIEEKQDKFNQDKIKKNYDMTLKQEEEYIKQYKKKQA